MWYVYVLVGIALNSITFLTLFSSCSFPIIFMQLEQEIDMILEKNGVFSSALQDWSNKWAPIILEYSSSLSGKKSMLASQIRTDCEGIYIDVALT